MNDIFYTQEKNSIYLQNELSDFDFRKNVVDEDDLDILSKNYKIFINADTLENVKAKEIIKKLGTLLQRDNNKLIVPFTVIGSLQEKMLANDINTVIAAKRGLNLLSKLQQKGVLDIRGEADDNTSREVFINVFSKFRSKYRLALLTQDEELAKEVMEFNNNELDGFRIIVIYINEDGHVIPFKYLNINESSSKDYTAQIDNEESLFDDLDGWDVID